MRKFIGLLLILLVAAPPAAAQSCQAAALAAVPLLEDAKVRIEIGETNEALVLIQAAQTLLDACETDSGEAVPVVHTQTDEPAEAAEVVDSAAEVADSPAVTNAVVNAPEVDLEKSITFIAFAHTSIDSGPIDVYTGQSNTLIVANLAFGEATGLIPFNGGPRRFVARPAGSGTDGDVLYRVEWDYLANSSWIVTAAGLLDELSFIVEPVSIVRSDFNGRARVRVVNLVPKRRVTVRSVDDVEFGNSLGWIGIKDTMVDAGSYTLEISADGKALMEPVSVELAEKITHTFYIIGHPDSDYPVQVLPIIVPQDMTRVRFVSSRSDEVDIHYRPTNDRIVESIAGDETSDWILLASGAATFIAYAPDTGPRGRELAALPLQLRPGRDMTITLDGQGFDMAEVTLTPP
jgi:hypothetical protein